jgi:hypothetical protein
MMTAAQGGWHDHLLERFYRNVECFCWVTQLCANLVPHALCLIMLSTVCCAAALPAIMSSHQTAQHFCNVLCCVQATLKAHTTA